MNFYNPYFYSAPATTSGLSGLFSRLNLSSIISGANKTLNFLNQTIPLAKQISPIVQNAKTMFKVMNEFKKTEPITDINNNDNFDNNTHVVNEISNNKPKYTYTNGPQFFL